jgi:hypothetical protein
MAAARLAVRCSWGAMSVNRFSFVGAAWLAALGNTACHGWPCILGTLAGDLWRRDMAARRGTAGARWASKLDGRDGATYVGHRLVAGHLLFRMVGVAGPGPLP